MSKSETSEDTNAIRPEWKKEKTSNTGIVVLGILVITLLLEIAGKKLQMDNIRVSALVSSLTVIFGTFFKKLGYFVAYISDILYVLQKVVTFVYDIVLPIFTSITDALYDIVSSILNLFGVSFTEFFEGYQVPMKTVIGGAYGKLAAYSVSSLLVIGSVLLIGLTFEAIGIHTKLNFFRPSFYVVSIANTIYYFFMSFSYLYGWAARVVVRFNEVINYVIEFLAPWLKPYIRALRNASGYMYTSVMDLAESPIVGTMNGFTKSIENLAKQSTGPIRFVFLLMIGCTVLYLWRGTSVFEYANNITSYWIFFLIGFVLLTVNNKPKRY